MSKSLEKSKDLTPAQQEELIKKFFEEQVSKIQTDINNLEEMLLERSADLRKLQVEQKDDKEQLFVYRDSEGIEKGPKELLKEFHESDEKLAKTLNKIHQILDGNEGALKELTEGSNAISSLMTKQATQLICFRKIDSDAMELEAKSDNKIERPK